MCLDLRRAGAMRVREVGDGELAIFGITRVRVGTQGFMPVPDLVAQCGGHAKLVVQTHFCDAMHIAQALGQFEFGMVQQTPLKAGDDLVPGKPGPTRPAHRQNEGKAEFGVVVGVEFLNFGKLGGRAIGEARLALFVGGFSGERFAEHGLAGQLGVGANQGQLGRLICLVHHLGQGIFQLG